MKIKNFSKNNVPLWAMVIIFVISSVFYLSTKRTQNISSVTPLIHVQEIQTSDTNGIYKNKKYGFQFEYPTNFFSKESISEEGGVWRHTEANGKYILLSVFVLKDKDYETQKDKYSDATMNSAKGPVLLSHTENKMFVNDTYYSKTPSNIETELVSEYISFWKSTKEKVSIELVFLSDANQDTYVKENKDIFANIVKSFTAI